MRREAEGRNYIGNTNGCLVPWRRQWSMVCAHWLISAWTCWKYLKRRHNRQGASDVFSLQKKEVGYLIWESTNSVCSKGETFSVKRSRQLWIKTAVEKNGRSEWEFLAWDWNPVIIWCDLRIKWGIELCFVVSKKLWFLAYWLILSIYCLITIIKIWWIILKKLHFPSTLCFYI